MYNQVIIIGASGHAKVIADIVIKSGDKLLGFLDDGENLPSELLGYPILGKVCSICKYINTANFIIGIGSNIIRKSLAEKFYDVKWYIAIHPSAQLGLDIIIGEGTAIMANVVINTSAKVGKHCIINTGSIIEHDNIIEDYVHISPQASLGGTVTIGELTHIGIGATIKNNISICGGCIIGAGAVVVKNIDIRGTYVGVPARNIKSI